MGLLRRRKARKADAEADAIFSVAYVAYCIPGMFGGDSTWISDSEKRGFMEKTRATPDQVKKARTELIDWMLAKASVPAESADMTREILATELLEEEFVTWLSDVTCNTNVRPPLFDTDGLRAKMQEVLKIPERWDSPERHSWRLQEARKHSRRLRESMIRVTRGPQQSALAELAAVSAELEKQSAVASSSRDDSTAITEYCGLLECPHCSPA